MIISNENKSEFVYRNIDDAEVKRAETERMVKMRELDIAEKKQQIETIEEYKKSLIFEYVTGKKEVQA